MSEKVLRRRKPFQAAFMTRRFLLHWAAIFLTTLPAASAEEGRGSWRGIVRDDSGQLSQTAIDPSFATQFFDKQRNVGVAAIFTPSTSFLSESYL